MKRLIVNADDFGLHSAVNRGIIEGYRRGCLRSTSFVAAGAAAEEAAALARECPGLGVGLHLTLVAERPVLPPEKVPSLVGADGRLLPDHAAFLRRYAAGGVRLAEIYAECEAQLLRARSLGICPTHLDSHQHLHVLPGVVGAALALAKAHGIFRMRLPAEPLGFTGGCRVFSGRFAARCGLTLCARAAARAMRRAGVATPRAFFGMLAGGQMSEPRLLAVLRALPEGVSEIMVHPGTDDRVLDGVYSWGYRWAEELAAVTAETVMGYIGAQGIRLISYEELTDGKVL